MCTLTILREPHRLLVTMNRDDVAAREELPPALSPNAEMPFAAPRDLQAGGTWIGANGDGVVACLLNRYDPAPPGRTSRGNIVLAAMQGSSITTACAALNALDHSAYSPFTCIVITQRGATRLDWTGSRLDREDIPNADEITMITSSSWQFDEVKAKREMLLRDLWAERDVGVGKIRAFHSLRIRDNDAWAPMMQRPHSETKSVTQVELTSSDVQMHYWTREAAIDRRLTSPEETVRFNHVKR
jgi:uncharacterized protein with NRDE domain